MKIYAANASGVYEYLPEQQTLLTIVTGDRRSSIARACGNAEAASAPLIIAVAYNITGQPYIGGELTYVEVGLTAQEVYLECAAWGLIANLTRADMNQTAMSEALGLNETTLHPTDIITVGHPSIITKVDAQDFFILERAWGTLAGQPGYDPRVDFNGDGVVDAQDFFILQYHWGQSLSTL
jgi:uncharacterized membrane protein